MRDESALQFGAGYRVDRGVPVLPGGQHEWLLREPGPGRVAGRGRDDRAAAFHRGRHSTLGPVVGSFLQVVVVALGFLVPLMFIVGGIFAVLWYFAVRNGSRVDALRKAYAEAQEN